MKPVPVIADLLLQNGDLKPKGRAIVVSHYLPYKSVLLGSPTAAASAPASPQSETSLRRSRHSGEFSLLFDLSLASGKDGKSWSFVQRADHSALYAGILSLKADVDTLIIGCVDRVYDERNSSFDLGYLNAEMKSSLKHALKSEHACHAIFLDSKLSCAHYEDLWPLFHYLLWTPSDGRMEKTWWGAYVKVNEIFADEIVQVYRHGDIIWIHDYHFLLVADMVRQKLPDATIGFFLHTPFPSSEIFRCLPQRVEILNGILGANIVGFQTYSYARHFISSCTRVLGVESTPKGIEYNGSQVSIEIFPIGIDVSRVESILNTQDVQNRVNTIRELYSGKKIIIGRDKLDQIKGVQHKLNAFEKFLETFPEWQDKVVLIQVTSPAEASSKLETRVSELVSRINGQYGSLGFSPVHHYHRHIDPEEYYALLTVADVALITAVRDGMNTTSHEFVVCQKENFGPLILSEFTGTAGSLSAAIQVNPWDYVGVATAIHDALVMSRDEKQIKQVQLYEYVTTNSAHFWASSFIKELQLVSSLPSQSNPTPKLDIDLLTKQFRESRNRLLFLDYDGTLTPIRKTPNAAVPPARMLEAMKRLTPQDGTVVYVISGRDQAALDGWLGEIPNLGMSAEHGCFIKYAGTHEWINLSQEMDLSWKNDVLPIFEYYTERTPGSFIEEKRSSLTWHYRLAEPEYGSWQAKECHNHLENAVLSKLPVEILVGKKNLEVRPQAINKGEIVKRLVGLTKDVDFVFCAGDDKTDEDMFRALKQLTGIPEGRCFTCTIGSATKKTQASWHVERSEDVVDVLCQLADIEGGKFHRQ